MGVKKGKTQLLGKKSDAKTKSFFGGKTEKVTDNEIKKLKLQIDKLKNKRNKHLYNRQGYLWNGKTQRFKDVDEIYTALRKAL